MWSACNKMIPAFEMVMRVRGGRVYHLECFQCSQCNHRFCIGDRFHLHENRILCEFDFEELSVFGSNATYNNHIEKLKKQTESLASSSPIPNVNPNDDGSSGYGSPDSLLSDGKWRRAPAHKHWRPIYDPSHQSLRVVEHWALNEQLLGVLVESLETNVLDHYRWFRLMWKIGTCAQWAVAFCKFNYFSLFLFWALTCHYLVAV